MTITFGERWQLRPLDSRNWELYHLHETASRTVARGEKAGSKNDDAGKLKWHPCGKYYQYNTIDNALRYAADVELKEKRADEAATIAEALDEWRGLLDGFLADVRDALGDAS